MNAVFVIIDRLRRIIVLHPFQHVFIVTIRSVTGQYITKEIIFIFVFGILKLYFLIIGGFNPDKTRSIIKTYGLLEIFNFFYLYAVFENPYSYIGFIRWSSGPICLVFKTNYSS